jgi:plasmid stabilization system protein ParE
MTRRFIVRPRAERDIQSAHDWYESQEPGLGERFLEAVQKRLEAIRDFPESCPIIYRDVRRAVVSRFPYLVFYVVQPTRVTVLAVLHHSRSPATWPRR